MRSGLFHRVSTTVAFALLVGTGCAESELPAERVVRRDSAGIEIVTSSSPGEGSTVLSSPELEFGVAEGDANLQFSRIVGATRVGDQIVVGDRGSNSIRFFDARGRFLHAAGSSGSGPGEFEYLRSVRRCRAGVITAFDLSWQTSEFELDGEFIDRWTLVMPDGRPPYRLACDQQGRTLLTGRGEFARTEGNYRTSASIYLATSFEGPFQVLGTFPGSDRIRLTDDMPHPFGRSTVVALSDAAVLVGTADDYELEVRDSEGLLRRLIRWKGPDRVLRPDHVEEYANSLIGRSPPERHPGIRRFVDEMVMPDLFPAYDELQVDGQGRIWLRAFSGYGDRPQLWWGFSRTGEWDWSLGMPADFTPLEFGDDEVLGFSVDELGVQRVRGYALNFSARGLASPGG